MYKLRTVHDAEALDFIRRDPRNPAEALVFAQGVGLDSHFAADRAPVEVQARFQRSGLVTGPRRAPRSTPTPRYGTQTTYTINVDLPALVQERGDLRALEDMVEETVHAYQHGLREEYRAGRLSADDPIFPWVQLMALQPVRGDELADFTYVNLPAEMHAKEAARFAYEKFVEAALSVR